MISRSILTDDVVAVSTIRILAIDMIDNAKSGHPGAPLGMAPTAHVLFSRHLVADPQDPKWINRDRVVLSNGHASALLYALLHLSGYSLSLEDLKQFRQLHATTPGHPESFKTPGVEVTTGPLGQGFANAVGLAIARENLAATYNRENYEIINNRTWVFCGDGCLQEGVAAEAASLAGHLRLKNLIVLYDDNGITIDGHTDNSFTEDVKQRFEAYGWNCISVSNGDLDIEGIDRAMALAKQSDRPTIIKIKTTIGFGSRLQGFHGVHGTPLLADDIKEIKSAVGVDPEQKFNVPAPVYSFYNDLFRVRGSEAHKSWTTTLNKYSSSFSKEAIEFKRRTSGKLPEGWKDVLPVYQDGDVAVGGRKYSEHVLNALASHLPELIGGSADLTSSNYTRVKSAIDFQPDESGIGSYKGNYIRYGVREHAMGAIMNGLSAYGGFIPFAGTFLNFVSYAAGAVRLSALSRHQVIWVATHDSIGLGEDGPTHQPVETAAWLRAMPNLHLWRPADGNEVSAAYLSALTSKETPSVLALSRQNLPQITQSSIELASKGGYIAANSKSLALQIVLIGTGSEVDIAIKAAGLLGKEKIGARVVSLPCWEVFNKQSKDYRLSVIPSGLPVLSVEAYNSLGWTSFSHEHVGLESWGDSAPPSILYEHFKITPRAVAERALRLINKFTVLGVEPLSPIVLESS